MSKFSDMTDAELAAWVDNFTTVVGENPTAYGMTAAQIDEMKANNVDFVAKIAARIAAEAAERATVIAKDLSRQTDESLASFHNTSIKANPNISNTLKTAAGIEIKKTPTYTPPAAPTGLIVNGFEDGTNMLKWERSGNKAGTQYIIEYREAADTEFEFLGVTTETTYTHQGATPGMQCAYRVKAQRANEQSTYSNVAVVYMV